MRPVDETPTDRTDYFALSGTYGTLLAALAATGRSKEPIRPVELVPLSAATFALSKLIVHEKVETWVRAPFVEESANGKHPKGRGLRYAIGELMSCTRCTGAWSALALVGLRLHSPAAARVVTAVLASSAGNDFLQSSFSLLAAASNKCDIEIENERRVLEQHEARLH
jgi:hypothetical protein